MLRTLALIALGLACLPGWSQEFRPYPQPRVTQDQWQTYFDQVRAKYIGSARQAPNQLLVAFDDGKVTQYVFTQPGHPAHPGWITRRVVQKDGRATLEQVGYFAGREEPFAALYQSYGALAKEGRESIRRRGQEAPAVSPAEPRPGPP
jgi:hypothetical protein